MIYKKVSILMNCYNAGNYLSESIESVLAQTYKNWEIILWDNQSVDDSKSIALSYADERIKYYLADNHSDLGTARARAFQKVTGDYIAFLDVDDIWMPQKLEKQIKVFENEEIGICFSNTIFFNQKRKEILYSKGLQKIPTTNSLITNYSLTLVSIVIDKKKLLQLPYAFDPNYSHTSDFDIIVRLSTISKVAYINEVLSGWRVHRSSETFKNSSKFIAEKRRWCEYHLKNEYMVNYRKYIKELEILLLAQKRMLCLSYTEIPKKKELLFKYSSLRNLAYVIFSYMPILPAILINFKRIIFSNKWF